MVVGQNGRIVQVLDNLLSNAASFSPKGGEIIFDLATNASPSEAILHILDEGPGIPDNRQETVFHRFYSER
ncbi:MAG: sensor histidine kinase, partial [Candidatus Puniceispirillaceae bacterium]